MRIKVEILLVYLAGKVYYQLYRSTKVEILLVYLANVVPAGTVDLQK